MNRKIILYFLTGLTASLPSCKHDFLELKQDQSLVIPTTLKDFQGLMDNSLVMNSVSASELGVIGSDEYYITDAVWNILPSAYQKQAYIWAKDVYQDITVNDWNNAYLRILYANTALDGALKLKPGNNEQSALNNLKGSALFFRAFNFYQLAQLFCKPYSPTTSIADPGIPLRLEGDINIQSSRTSVSETYQQIINDLKLAADLLPENPLIKSRPGKPAAFALLAKTFLLMGNYELAAHYASQCLQLKSELIDFNTSSLALRYPFPDYELNPEVLFVTSMINAAITGTTRINIATDILSSYPQDDLRKQAYFFTNADGRIIFKGSYRGNAGFFTGLATDEVLLIRAECYARKGETLKALEDLNTLRKARINKASYIAATTANAHAALVLIIAERKKELLLRGIRWEDLRRLNKEPEFAITLSRTVNGVKYELPPDDNRYTWAIPDNEITLSGFQQNQR